MEVSKMAEKSVKIKAALAALITDGINIEDIYYELCPIMLDDTDIDGNFGQHGLKFDGVLAAQCAHTLWVSRDGNYDHGYDSDGDADLI